MNELRALIDETAGKIFRDHCTKDLVDEAERGVWPAELWQTLEDAGLTRAAVPENLGGSGGTLADAMTVLRQAGRHAAPLPLAETFLAGWILSQAGCAVPEGPITIALGESRDALALLPQGDDLWSLSGTARRVAWASEAPTIVFAVVHGPDTFAAILDRAALRIEPGENIAGEPRDTVYVEDVNITSDQIHRLPSSLTLERIRELGALTRVELMAGAMRSIMAMTIEHANTRLQFGRPIGSFQAVRQQLAVLAGQVAAAGKAADVAVEAADGGEGSFEIAVAKARVGEAAGIVAGIAHQAHGAMGITHEHALHQYTRRLWAWRDEYGSEAVWQTELGRQAAAGGADQLWKFITAT